MGKNKLYAVVKQLREGKTLGLKRLVDRLSESKTPIGFLQHSVVNPQKQVVGYDIEIYPQRTRLPLSRVRDGVELDLRKVPKDVKMRMNPSARFQFHQESFDKAASMCLREIESSIEGGRDFFVFIDEVGKLEIFHDSGHHHFVTELAVIPELGPSYCTVRTDFFPDLLSKYGDLFDIEVLD